MYVLCGVFLMPKEFVADQREPSHSKTIKSDKSDKFDEKEVYLIIQNRENNNDETLRIKVPAKTKIGDIKKYISKKFGGESNYFYMTKLDLKKKSKGVLKEENEKEKVNIIFKTIGPKENESKLRVPRDIKISVLKEALASKFGLSSNDFQLVLNKEKK